MSRTREKLIESAFELFGRNGFHAIGIDAILSEVGVSKQTFYNHFESKDDLILAVLELRQRTLSELFARLFKQVGGDDPREQLYALIDVLAAWFNAPDWRGCIFLNATAEFPLPTDPAHRMAAEFMRGTRKHLQHLATLAAAPDPTRLADELLIIMEGVVAVRHTSGTSDCVPRARRMVFDLLDAQLPTPAVGRPQSPCKPPQDQRAAASSE